jgi:hypothetical protein
MDTDRGFSFTSPEMLKTIDVASITDYQTQRVNITERLSAAALDFSLMLIFAGISLLLYERYDVR